MILNALNDPRSGKKNIFSFNSIILTENADSSFIDTNRIIWYHIHKELLILFAIYFYIFP